MNQTNMNTEQIKQYMNDQLARLVSGTKEYNSIELSTCTCGDASKFQIQAYHPYCGFCYGETVEEAVDALIERKIAGAEQVAQEKLEEIERAKSLLAAEGYEVSKITNPSN